MAKSKLPKITQLTSSSVQTLVKNPKIIWVAAVVLIPSRFLGSSGTGEVGAFAAIAAILMNQALIWAVGQNLRGKKFTLKDAYYKGTAGFLRFVLVALALVAMMVPLVIALSIAAFGILPPTAVAAERILLGIVAILLAAPTVYWLNRYAFGLIAASESDLGPVAALRQSGQLVKGRWLPVFKLMVVAFLLISVLGALPVLLLAATGGHANQYLLLTLQTAIGLLSLPFLNVYAYQIYRSLDGQSKSR